MLLADAKSDVLQQLNRHRGYRLVVTGHSLGGGAGRVVETLSITWFF